MNLTFGIWDNVGNICIKYDDEQYWIYFNTDVGFINLFYNTVF